MMRTEPIDKWVRGYVGDTAVVDSHAPLLFWEDGFPVPHYAFARADVREDLLRPAADGPAPDLSFHGPQGPVSQWFDLQVEGRTIPRAAWVRDDPELAGLLILSWQPGVLDRWLEEEEEVAGHPRDPHKRVETIASSRHVTVALNGVTLADSHAPVLLFETSLPTRYYLPREDVNFAALTPNAGTTFCPYKGTADSYWSAPDAKNIAWSYSAPYAAVGKVVDRVGFYNEFVDITVDDVAQERPESPFSKR